MSEAFNENEDRVVREIDIYLSTSSAPEYHLLQYPGHFVNPIPQPPLAVRMKPRHHILEAEHAVYAESHSRVYQSQTIPINTHLCFGRVFVDEVSSKTSMHLIPISQISQMRPTFHHLSNHDEDDEDFDQTDRMDVSREYRERQESEDLSPVPSATNITFHRKESDRAVAARKSSYAFQHASQENEPWVALDVVERTADLPELPNPSSTYIPKSSYIQTLNYIPTKSATTGTYPPTLVASTHPNRNTVAQKLLQVLQHGGPVPWSILMLAVQDPSSSDLAETPWDVLNVMAVVVRGNWYLHSKYLRPNAPSGPSSQRLRTFVLLLLQEFGQIHRSALQKVVDGIHSPHWSGDRMMSVLRQVAEPPSSTRHHWATKMADDDALAHKYPIVARLHDAYWKKQHLRFAKELQLYSHNL